MVFTIGSAGCGTDCVIAANQTLALHRVPRKEGSTAAGVYQTGMKIGTTLGVALCNSLYCAAALAALAFAIALPGFTLRVRDPAVSVAAPEEVEPAR